ncbi:MAG TPA: O-antigen ligase family protein [Leptospiraceae bacterium]|nr:O-antigen ligase family protein [Leptospiraceae bacterium]
MPSFFWNIKEYQWKEIASVFTRSEFSDFWMCFIVLPAFYHIRNLEYRKVMIRFFFISVGLVIVSGFISIFTPFRLAKFITDGFQVKEGVRLQHFAGDLWGRYTYLPIGLMNTHLTFGGLCGLFFPGISSYFLLTIPNRKTGFNLLLGFVLLVFSIVLFYNQSRSIWLGLFFTFGLIAVKLTTQIDFGKVQSNWKILFLFFGVFIFILIVSVSIYKKNWLLQRAFQEGLKDNTTENQRYFIYKNTFAMIRDHWGMGVGPGRFDKEHLRKSEEMISQNEQLWYELFITPRQHAHHDPLHFYMIGGIFGLVTVLHFWFYLFRLFLKNSLTDQTVLFSGILVLFVAGFFQCYLLDDEVALPFFAFIGLFGGSLQKEDARSKAMEGIKARKKANLEDSFLVESLSLGNRISYLKNKIALNGKNSPFEKYNFFTLCILFIPLIVSISFILFKIRLDPMYVYNRKITLQNLEDKILVQESLRGKQVLFPTSHMKEKDFIRIEGCLSHRFGKPILIRKEPFQLSLSLFNTENPPKQVFIRVIERDAFDQDQLYRVHQFKEIGDEYKFDLNPHQKNRIRLDDPKLFQDVKVSSRFPENIYFRDFAFHFEGFDKTKESFDFPQINFGDLCNAE